MMLCSWEGNCKPGIKKIIISPSRTGLRFYYQSR